QVAKFSKPLQCKYFFINQMVINKKNHLPGWFFCVSSFTLKNWQDFAHGKLCFVHHRPATDLLAKMAYFL
ncbi:hypothetical protein CUT98_23210, partial [Klebsiella pneumoniae]